MDLNIKFADNNEFISYSDDSWFSPGCPTCDYGSKYVNEISIITTHYRIDITLRQMYEYAFSTADAIKILAVDLRGMTEEEFLSYIDKEFHKYDALDEFEIIKRR